eukprot:SAG11_NODE_13371_length_658_cov_0.847943_1_plen_77_part_00
MLAQPVWYDPQRVLLQRKQLRNVSPRQQRITSEERVERPRGAGPSRRRRNLVSPSALLEADSYAGSGGHAENGGHD